MNYNRSHNFNHSQVELALRNSQKQLQEITDSIDAGIAYVDSERKYRFVNRFYEQRFNRSRETMIGKYVWQVVGQETYENVKNLINKVLQGESQQLEFYITYDTGITAYIQCFLTPAFDDSDKVIGYYLVLFDITERKNLEESLKEANEELYRLATIDTLTKVANRRRFDEYISQEWRRLWRTTDPLSLILFDVDYFKKYNDCYGHPQGDKCLTQIAKIAKIAVKRSSDFVARYGGEEFAVILSNTNQLGAMVVAERIRQKIKEAAIPHEGSKISSIVSISLGVACMIPSLEESPDTLINLADQALYQAKNQGRDCYYVVKEN